jgi:hypothetical protein
MSEAGFSVGLWAAALLACAGLSGSSSAKRLAVIGVATIALLSPLWFPDRWVLARFVFTAAGVLVFGRGLDLALRPTRLSFGGRLWLLTALFDVRRAERGAAAVDRDEVRWLLVHTLISTVTALAILRLVPGLEGPARWLLRWSFGVGFCYAVVEALHSLLLIGYRLGGIRLPRINDFPIRSTTLAEFWGRRWNRVVAGWLRDYLFFPLARQRRMTLGICGAFAGSTLLHFWLAWVPLDVEAGLLMASFFVVQAGLLLLERRLAVAMWPRARQRRWTITWLLLSSPLFVEPALRIYFDSL